MGGIRGIEEVMKRKPVPILVLSGHAGKGTEAAAQALAAGALEAMPKRSVRLDRGDDVWAVAVRSRIKRLATVQMSRRRVERPAPPPSRRRVMSRPVRVIGIGSSTGGPQVLSAILGSLPADFPIPILAVQHMPSGFVEGLVRWLDGEVSIPVGLARDEMELQPGVWVAPDDLHLELRPTMRLATDSDRRGSRHHPSIDVLLRSLAKSAAAEAVAVVLTGMGRDGAEGVGSVTAAGGLAIAQDEESSAVFGMPRGAIEAGAEIVLAPAGIGEELRRHRVVEDGR
jgi:two-component system chemotaxis response regulator CheB